MCGPVEIRPHMWRYSTINRGKQPLFDSVEVYFIVERLAIDPEEFGGLRLVAAGRSRRTGLLYDTHPEKKSGISTKAEIFPGVLVHYIQIVYTIGK